MKRTLLLAFLTTLVFAACKREKPKPFVPTDPTPTTGTLSLNVVTKFNGAPFAFYTDFHNGLNQRMQFEVMRFYLSQFFARTSAGDSLMVLDALKYDLAIGQTSTSFSMEPGDYTGMSIGFGVDSIHNHSDPTTYDPSHPLSYNQSNTMHWSWSSGYIFMKVEGKSDPSGVGTGTPTHLFAFHPGSDGCYNRTDFLPKSFSITAGSTTTLNLVVDVAGFFTQPGDTLDLTVDSVTHTFDNVALAKRFAGNVSKSIWFE